MFLLKITVYFFADKIKKGNYPEILNFFNKWKKN